MDEKSLRRWLEENPDLAALNRDLVAAQPPPPPRPQRQPLAEQFLALWSALGGDDLEPEYRFAPPRRWRFDFALPEKRIAVEINGGVWSHGRHVRGRGYLNDREKINAAQAMGWRVFELGTGQITPDAVMRILEVARG